jgi:chromate reductase
VGHQLLRPQTQRNHRSLPRRDRHRGVLSFLDAPQLNSPEAYITFHADDFGENGEVHNNKTEAFLRHYMEEYCAFVQRVLSVNAPGHIGDANPVDNA